MIEQLRMLGLHMGTAGAGIMEQMIRNNISTKDLSERQIQDVLYAWDARNVVPACMREEIIANGDIVKPAITNEEVSSGVYTQEEYDRNYVEMIEKYLKTMM
ncbi:MAG: hypothetical protein HFJ48_05370 [Clostridia bacterium]|nr:hypothetical protein [Clostridia bacterium]